MSIKLPAQPATQTLRPHQVSGYIKQTNDTWLFPEIAPPQGYKTLKNLILTLGEKNYEVKVTYNDPEMPESGEIEFIPTDKPATPFSPVIPRSEHLDTIRELYFSDQDALTEPEKQEVREYLNTDNFEVYAFGQPSFIQGEIYPNYNGKAVYPLLRIENGWGDCGNVNIFVALENNIPVAAYLEASCC